MARIKQGVMRFIGACLDVFWGSYTNIVGIGRVPSIKWLQSREKTGVDDYWAEHTVNAPLFKSAHQSRRYIEWRFKAHAMFKELSGLYGNHENEIVLDYGCGPGNDVTGFALFSKAKKIIGMDVSEKALKLTARRLSLHKIDVDRIELIHLSDSVPKIPLDDQSVDFINCQGVLMNTSSPGQIIKEFYRVLKSGRQAILMIYNRDSIWFHLYTAYQKMIIEGAFAGMSIEEAFSRNTDGEDCPISRCYTPSQFGGICSSAGFSWEFKGGHFSDTETTCCNRFCSVAQKDQRLQEEYRKFLAELTFDSHGLPLYRGKYAGVGGIFHLIK